MAHLKSKVTGYSSKAKFSFYRKESDEFGTGCDNKWYKSLPILTITRFETNLQTDNLTRSNIGLGIT
jgi:hypothetical protein